MRYVSFQFLSVPYGTSRDCFYCGKRAAAGKSCSVLFFDGRGCPPSDSEIIQYAQLCDSSDTTIKHDAGHAALRRGISEIACNSFACYRLLKDVNNYVAINVRGTRSVGEASSSTTILPAHRKEVLTAAEKRLQRSIRLVREVAYQNER